MTIPRHGSIAQTLKIYKESASKATAGFFQNWIVLVASAVLSWLFLQIQNVLALSGSGLGGGFLLGFIMIAALTLYYSWLESTVKGEKLTLKNLFEYDYALFFQVMSVAFLLFIAEFLLSIMMQGELMAIALCIKLGMVVIFNAVPETIYIKRYESMEALTYAFDFIKNNWVEWFIPMVVLISPWLFYNADSALVTLAQADPLLPPFFILKGVATSVAVLGEFGRPLFALLAGVVVAHWFMLFRGHLFRAYEGVSRFSRFSR